MLLEYYYTTLGEQTLWERRIDLSRTRWIKIGYLLPNLRGTNNACGLSIFCTSCFIKEVTVCIHLSTEGMSSIMFSSGTLEISFWVDFLLQLLYVGKFKWGFCWILLHWRHVKHFVLVWNSLSGLSRLFLMIKERFPTACTCSRWSLLRVRQMNHAYDHFWDFVGITPEK